MFHPYSCMDTSHIQKLHHTKILRLAQQELLGTSESISGCRCLDSIIVALYSNPHQEIFFLEIWESTLIEFHNPVYVL